MEGAYTVLFQYGLAGVVILGLSLTVRVLYQDNQRLHEIIAKLQDERRSDAVETMDKVTQPLAGMAQTLSLLTEKVVTTKRGGK